MQKYSTIFALMILTGVAQAGVPTDAGMVYDPVDDYYQQYYLGGAVHRRATQADAQVETPAAAGMAYDPMDDYYQQYYGTQSRPAAMPETGNDRVATGMQWPEGL